MEISPHRDPTSPLYPGMHGPLADLPYLSEQGSVETAPKPHGLSRGLAPASLDVRATRHFGPSSRMRAPRCPVENMGEEIGITRRETMDPERDNLRKSPSGGRNAQTGSGEQETADRSPSSTFSRSARPATGETLIEAREIISEGHVREDTLSHWISRIWTLLWTWIASFHLVNLWVGGGEELIEADSTNEVMEATSEKAGVMERETASRRSERRTVPEQENGKVENPERKAFLKGLEESIDRSLDEFSRALERDLRSVGPEDAKSFAKMRAEAIPSRKHNGGGSDDIREPKDCKVNTGTDLDQEARDDCGDNGGIPSEEVKDLQQSNQETSEGLWEDDIQRLEGVLRAERLRREERLKMLVLSCKWENFWTQEYSEEEAWDSTSEESSWETLGVLSEDEDELEVSFSGVNDGVLPREEMERMDLPPGMNVGVLPKRMDKGVLLGGVNDLQDGSFGTSLEANTTMLGTSSTQHREEEGFSRRAKFKSLWWQACILFGRVLAALLPEEEREER